MYNCTTMMQITTSPRKAKETKKEGFIPAVYYGTHAASTPIFVDAIEFNKVLATAGESSSVTLKTEHGNETAMIQDVQVHPVKGQVIHVDFYVLEKGQKVHVKTPVVFVGESILLNSGYKDYRLAILTALSFFSRDIIMYVDKNKTKYFNKFISPKNKEDEDK